MNSAKFIKKLYSAKELEEIETKLKCLGNDTKYTVTSFCTHRILVTILAFILTIIITDMGYIYAPFVSVIIYYLFYYLNITKKIALRNRKLEHQALYFFEILTLTLESGRNLENALIVTCDNVDSELSLEFKKALDDMKFGKSLIETLTDFKKYALAVFCGLLATYIIGLSYKYFILNFYLNTPISWKLVLLSCFPIDLPCDIALSILAIILATKLKKSGGLHVKKDIK